MGVVVLTTLLAAAAPYPFAETAAHRPLSELPSPAGFSRVKAFPGSFGHYLRHLPLHPPGTPVLAHDGSLIDGAPAGVFDIDVGRRDLQQCADFVIRLYAEYLWAQGRRDDVAFAFTSGHIYRYSQYARGLRPRVRGAKVQFVKQSPPDQSRAGFRRYLDLVFIYAGTRSLEKSVARPADGTVRPGDFFVIGGGPGHAVIVLDVAESDDGAQRMLLGEGYMPAQSFHLIANRRGGVWHDVRFPLDVPSWPVRFGRSSHRRFGPSR